MLTSILYNDMTFWLLGTAIVFTLFGRYTVSIRYNVKTVVESTIDSLIEQGYIKTKGKGDNIEILKHWE